MRNMRLWLIISIFVVCSLAMAVGAMGASYAQLVYQAQKKLAELGYYPGPIDGKMGPKTEAELKKYQNDHGLPVTGRLDEQTLQKLGITDVIKPSSPPPKSPSRQTKVAPRDFSSRSPVRFGIQGGYGSDADFAIGGRVVFDVSRYLRGCEAIGSFDYFFPNIDFPGIDYRYFEFNANVVYKLYSHVLSTIDLKNIRIAPAFRPGTMKPSSFPPLSAVYKTAERGGGFVSFFHPRLESRGYSRSCKIF